MFPLEMVILGLALATDAAVVCFTLGLVHAQMPVSQKWQRGVFLASLFGLFQFLMLWLGSYGGYLFTFSSFGHLFQLIVAGIFFIIGAKFFQESLDDKAREIEWGFLSLLLLALATSVDALAAGVSFGALPRAWLPALEVGIITFFLSLLFYGLSQTVKNIPDKWLFRFAALVFVGLGAHVVYSYVKRGAL